MRTILLLVVLVGCGQPKGDPKKLEALTLEIASIASDTKDRSRAELDRLRELASDLVPTKATLDRVLRSEIPDDVREKLLATYERMADRPDRIFDLSKHETDVRVEASTVPDGDPLLKPGLEIYAVTFKDPDKRDGTKYKRFIWDGQRWKMLGKMRLR